MPRWILPLIATAIGIALGLLYGWVIDPVKFVDTTPASLRSDYRADYVLMVAEAYHADRNSELASRRLAIFGGESPALITEGALQIGRRVGYSQSDISLIQELARALQAYQPAPALIGVSPEGGTP